MNKLIPLYLKVRKNRNLSFFVIWMRYLIGFAFVPSGLTKLLGQRFTVLPVSHPVGFFFEAMYQTGFYWNFLGFVQMLSAFLLMTQRFATIGNLIFLAIITNVYLITAAMAFKGTVFITFLLLVASVGMLLWDFPKWVSLFSKDNFALTLEHKDLPTYQPLWVITGFIFFIESILFGLLPKLLPIKGMTTMFVMLGVIVATAIIVLIIHAKNRFGLKER